MVLPLGAIPQAPVQKGGFGKSTSNFNRGVYRPVQTVPTAQQLLQMQFLEGKGTQGIQGRGGDFRSAFVFVSFLSHTGSQTMVRAE